MIGAELESGLDPKATPFAFETVSAAVLQNMIFPEIKWIVSGILPEGLTLLCGKPKLGKSWWVLDVGQAVATGGSVLDRECQKGDVLYLALEDNHRRLKKRLDQIQEQVAWPDNLHFATEAPRLGEGCLRKIRHWCDDHPNGRLVIVDTLGTVRPTGKRNETDYSADYTALRGLQQLAGELGIAIVVVHHVRKAEADDPFDTVSGSTGLTGAADSTLILTKRAGDGGCVLYGRGRDLMEFELAVEFDADICRWRSLGDPTEAYANDTKRKIFDAMQVGKSTPREISAETGIDYDLTKKTLQRMAVSDEIQKEGRGKYVLINDPLS